MKYKILGVNRETGNAAEPMMIDAASDEAALAAASERGIFIEKITPLHDEPPLRSPVKPVEVVPVDAPR